MVHNRPRKITLLDVESGAIDREIDWPSPYRPLVVDDLLVANGFESMYAGRLSDGKLLWTYPLNQTAETVISCVYSASPAALFIGRADGGVEAISIESGELLWRTSVAGLSSPTPEGRVPGRPMGSSYVFGDLVILRLWARWVVALSVADGQIVWKRELGNAISDGQLYGDRYYATAFIDWYYILDAKTGEVLLETHLGPTTPRSVGQIVQLCPILVSETHLFAGVSPARVLAFERDTGRFAWWHRTKGGGVFQSDTHFVSANGRLYCADMAGLLYCLEQTASVRHQGDDANVAVAGEDGHLRFEVLEVLKQQCMTAGSPDHASGGDWIVLRCRCGEANFFVAARGEGKGALSWGEGRIWVPAAADGDGLLRAVRQAFEGRRTRPKRAQGVQPPTSLGVAFLGTGVDEAGTGEGGWTHSKWSGEQGWPEFYVRWSEQEKAGVIAEKDEAYRKGVVELFASLVVRS